MGVKLARKTETVYYARVQWACGTGRDGNDIVPFGLLWERKSYDDASIIVEEHVTMTYRAPDGETTRFYHTWLEQITRYDDGSEESLMVREYNRPAPYELRRYEVTFTKPGEPDFHTFTWGKTRDDAYNRVAETKSKSPDVWGGWSFDVAYEATEVVERFVSVLKAHHGHTVKVTNNGSDAFRQVDAHVPRNDLEWNFRGFVVHCQNCNTPLSEQWS